MQREIERVTSLAEVWIETGIQNSLQSWHFVTSLAEVWIETTYKSDLERPRSVTSLAEVWIETGRPQRP